MNKNISIIADRSERIDKYISNQLSLSRALVEEMIKDRKIKIDGSFPKKNHKLQPGNVIEIEEVIPKEIDVLPVKMELDILYEDEHIIIINKARGLVVHPAPGNYDNTIVNGLLYHDKHLSLINGKYRPGIVHRIDKDTSGIIVVAKNDIAHNKLAEDFKNHNINRKYLALVVGELSEGTGSIDLPIARDPASRIKMGVNSKGKPAKTNYKVLERFNGYTLVECTLETGRTHQIRVHFSYMKYPLVGDPLYGVRRDKFPLDGQYLHAFLLGINHPVTGEYIEFIAEIPEYFNNRLKEIRNS
ncbi:MAG: RluA family pseudouridine synthase [Fusobacteria bacterium]|nr:RluA family pseudouridine synthase [Fusobacteriota bacterium]